MSVQQRIETKIRTALAPSHLEVINESHKHSVPPGSESHFKLVIVSPTFEGKPLPNLQSDHNSEEPLTATADKKGGALDPAISYQRAV